MVIIEMIQPKEALTRYKKFLLSCKNIFILQNIKNQAKIRKRRMYHGGKI
jgi:hypothetical protein